MRFSFQISLWWLGGTLSVCHGFVGTSRLAPTLSLFSSLESNQAETIINSFADLGLSAQVLSAVKAQPGWDKPTPVQQMAIPRLLQLVTEETADRTEEGDKEGEVDAVWCEAPTGSGKTAAFALPLLQNLQGRSTKGRISALILCPTRELAAQIGSVMQNLANNVSSK